MESLSVQVTTRRWVLALTESRNKCAGVPDGALLRLYSQHRYMIACASAEGLLLCLIEPEYQGCFHSIVWADSQHALGDTARPWCLHLSPYAGAEANGHLKEGISFIPSNGHL